VQKASKTAEMVTGYPKMTDCDGLPVLDWRSFFLRETSNNPSPIRHPSPKAKKREYSQIAPDVSPPPEFFFEPCEDGGRYRNFYAGARFEANQAKEVGADSAPTADDDLETRFADVLCAARLSEMEPSLCEMVISAAADADRIIVAQRKKSMGESVSNEKELRVLGDLLCALEGVQRNYRRRVSTRAP
jgi:hypothetical protein